MKYPPATKKDELRGMIRTIRGVPVILDADLARAYGVTTKALNQAVKRNRERFPREFVFSLEAAEAANLMSQIVTSSVQLVDVQSDESNRPQIVTTYGHGGRRKAKWAFTEHGAIMAAMVLKSPRAVQMSVFVVRAFVAMRSLLTSQNDLARKLAELERNLPRKTTSFRLQTSTDSFYPDFICRLKDGRILVVEYKGAHLYDGVDAEEKRLVGAVWEARSNGRCLFVMPSGLDWSGIVEKVRGR